MNATETTARVAAELSEVKKELAELLERAQGALSELGYDNKISDRAHRTWVADLTMALDNEHSYIARGSHTLQDTLNELENEQKPTCEEVDAAGKCDGQCNRNCPAFRDF